MAYFSFIYSTFLKKKNCLFLKLGPVIDLEAKKKNQFEQFIKGKNCVYF